MSEKKEDIGYYDYAEFLDDSSRGVEPKETTINQYKRKKPEELELSDFIEQIKQTADRDNDEAKKIVYEIIHLLEEDEKNFWRLSAYNVLNFIQYAGYHTEEDMEKAFKNLRSIEKYKEYKVRRIKKIISKIQSKIGRIVSPKKSKSAQEEQKASEESQQDVSENAANDSNNR